MNLKITGRTFWSKIFDLHQRWRECGTKIHMVLNCVNIQIWEGECTTLKISTGRCKYSECQYVIVSCVGVPEGVPRFNNLNIVKIKSDHVCVHVEQSLNSIKSPNGSFMFGDPTKETIIHSQYLHLSASRIPILILLDVYMVWDRMCFGVAFFP